MKRGVLFGAFSSGQQRVDGVGKVFLEGLRIATRILVAVLGEVFDVVAPCYHQSGQDDIASAGNSLPVGRSQVHLIEYDVSIAYLLLILLSEQSPCKIHHLLTHIARQSTIVEIGDLYTTRTSQRAYLCVCRVAKRERQKQECIVPEVHSCLRMAGIFIWLDIIGAIDILYALCILYILDFS